MNEAIAGLQEIRIDTEAVRAWLKQTPAATAVEILANVYSCTTDASTGLPLTKIQFARYVHARSETSRPLTVNIVDVALKSRASAETADAIATILELPEDIRTAITGTFTQASATGPVKIPLAAYLRPQPLPTQLPDSFKLCVEALRECIPSRENQGIRMTQKELSRIVFGNENRWGLILSSRAAGTSKALTADAVIKMAKALGVAGLSADWKHKTPQRLTLAQHFFATACLALELGDERLRKDFLHEAVKHGCLPERERKGINEKAIDAIKHAPPLTTSGPTRGSEVQRQL